MKTTSLRAAALCTIAVASFAVVGCSSDDSATDSASAGDEVSKDLGAGASTIADDVENGLDDQWAGLKSAADDFDAGAKDLPSDLQAGWDQLHTDISTNAEKAKTSAKDDVSSDWDQTQGRCRHVPLEHHSRRRPDPGRRPGRLGQGEGRVRQARRQALTGIPEPNSLRPGGSTGGRTAC